MIYEQYFLIAGLGPVYKRNSIEFSIDFLELKSAGYGKILDSLYFVEIHLYAFFAYYKA